MEVSAKLNKPVRIPMDLWLDTWGLGSKTWEIHHLLTVSGQRQKESLMQGTNLNLDQIQGSMTLKQALLIHLLLQEHSCPSTARMRIAVRPQVKGGREGTLKSCHYTQGQLHWCSIRWRTCPATPTILDLTQALSTFSQQSSLWTSLWKSAFCCCSFACLLALKLCCLQQ